MTKRNKMLDGMLIGASIGAVVSLLDKETRTTVINNGNLVKNKTVKIMKNPEMIKVRVRETIHSVLTTIEQVSEDVSYLAGKVNELTETTPAVIEVVREVKESITNQLEKTDENSQ